MPSGPILVWCMTKTVSGPRPSIAGGQPDAGERAGSSPLDSSFDRQAACGPCRRVVGRKTSRWRERPGGLRENRAATLRWSPERVRADAGPAEGPRSAVSVRELGSLSRHCRTVRVAAEERSTHFQSSGSAGASDLRRSVSSEAKTESTCTRSSVVRSAITAMWRSMAGRNPASDTRTEYLPGLR